MKILCAYHGVPKNPGGIVNHQELLGNALQQLGHTVEMRSLVWTEKIVSRSEPSRKLPQELGLSSGMLFDQELGWFWPREKRIPYKGSIQAWHDLAIKFDLIIWQTPVPTLRNDTEGNSSWPNLYDLPGVKQLAVIHDGNVMDSYPWIYEIKD